MKIVSVLWILVITFLEKEVVAQTCPANQAIDVVFLLDGSNSVGTDNFNKMKEWVVTTSASLNMSTNDVFVGVIVYSSFDFDYDLENQAEIITVLPISNYSLVDISSEVLAAPYMMHTTDTAHALAKSVLDFEDSERWGQDIRRRVVLVTEGLASDPEYLSTANSQLAIANIQVLVVGISHTEQAELLKIAGSAERVFDIDTFNDLDSDLANDVANKAVEC